MKGLQFLLVVLFAIKFNFQAIRRLVNRDNLTEEQAKQRVDAQPKNEVMVKESNVVFSTQWSYEFSQQQVLTSVSREVS